MPEAFKNLLNVALIRDAAAQLQNAWPRFDASRFVARASHGLEPLEMKARAMQICEALEATLPSDFDAAAQVIESALAPPQSEASLAESGSLAQGLQGWILWPVGEFIARRGLSQPERALAALHAMTQRFTAEFALRPFIVSCPGIVWPTLQRWCHDPSAAVRRLVSEGSRPRLPWGLQLKSLITDPSPTLPLLLALQDDPDEVVRRSVANHLNDIAKDHPALVADWVERHLPGAGAKRRALLRHASRSLIKQADLRMLGLWGLGQALQGTAKLALSPRRLRLGESFTLTLQLHSTSRRVQHLAVDYLVHHRKANGSLSPKVFKGWVIDLPAGAELELSKRHSMRAVTTRRYYGGEHRVSVQINGRDVAQAAFSLSLVQRPDAD